MSDYWRDIASFTDANELCVAMNFNCLILEWNIQK